METCLTDWWTTAIMNSCQKNLWENCRAWGREKDLLCTLWTSTPGNLASKAIWRSVLRGAAAESTAISLNLLRSNSSTTGLLTSCRMMGGTIGANVIPYFNNTSMNSRKLNLITHNDTHRHKFRQTESDHTKTHTETPKETHASSDSHTRVFLLQPSFTIIQQQFTRNNHYNILKEEEETRSRRVYTSVYLGMTMTLPLRRMVAHRIPEIP